MLWSWGVASILGEIAQLIQRGFKRLSLNKYINCPFLLFSSGWQYPLFILFQDNKGIQFWHQRLIPSLSSKNSSFWSKFPPLNNQIKIIRVRNWKCYAKMATARGTHCKVSFIAYLSGWDWGCSSFLSFMFYILSFIMPSTLAKERWMLISLIQCQYQPFLLARSQKGWCHLYHIIPPTLLW